MSETQLQPWQWPEETWRGHIERVRAGAPLARQEAGKRWPGGARVAVAISFDSDHETPALRDGEISPGRMAQGEYGARRGVPRIMDLLDRFDIKASFYMPAVCALVRPEEANGYVEAGHELAVHGWIHERNTLLEYADELELIHRSIDTLESITGVRPVGIRTPSWDFSPHTLDVIREVGLQYDSSLMADDEPYELLADGERTGVIEIPVEWIRDDAPYLMMERYQGLRPYMAPRNLLQIWIDEFDVAYEEGGLFQLTLHPHYIGHRSRMLILEKLLEHISAKSGIWFATHAEVAAHVRAAL